MDEEDRLGGTTTRRDLPCVFLRTNDGLGQEVLRPTYRVDGVTGVTGVTALAALAVSEPTGRHHDITGPESADPAGIASITAEAWGTPVAYVDIPDAVYCAETAATGLDPWWLYAFSSMFASVREQRWARVCDDYTRLTGRSPLALRDVLSAQG